MNNFSKLMLILGMICLGSSLVACEKPGPAEQAGKKMDDTFNSMKEKANELTK